LELPVGTAADAKSRASLREQTARIAEKSMPLATVFADFPADSDLLGPGLERAAV
jgi:hypothetical protein